MDGMEYVASGTCIDILFHIKTYKINFIWLNRKAFLGPNQPYMLARLKVKMAKNACIKNLNMNNVRTYK